MRTKNEIKSRGTEVKSPHRWGTLLHIDVQEREKTWPPDSTGLRWHRGRKRTRRRIVLGAGRQIPSTGGGLTRRLNRA